MHLGNHIDAPYHPDINQCLSDRPIKRHLIARNHVPGDLDADPALSRRSQGWTERGRNRDPVEGNIFITVVAPLVIHQRLSGNFIVEQQQGQKFESRRPKTEQGQQLLRRRSPDKATALDWPAVNDDLARLCPAYNDLLNFCANMYFPAKIPYSLRK